jgi:hypothetical protein
VKQYVLSVLLITFCELPALAAKPSPCDLVLTKKNLILKSFSADEIGEINAIARLRPSAIYSITAPRLGRQAGLALLNLKNVLAEETELRAKRRELEQLAQMASDEGHISGSRAVAIPNSYDLEKSDARIASTLVEVAVELARFEAVIARFRSSQINVNYAKIDDRLHEGSVIAFGMAFADLFLRGSTTGIDVFLLASGARLSVIAEGERLESQVHNGPNRKGIDHKAVMALTTLAGLGARTADWVFGIPLGTIENTVLARKMKQSFYASLSEVYGDKITDYRALKKELKKLGQAWEQLH